MGGSPELPRNPVASRSKLPNQRPELKSRDRGGSLRLPDVPLRQSLGKPAGVVDDVDRPDVQEVCVPGHHEFNEATDRHESVHAEFGFIGVRLEMGSSRLNHELRRCLQRHGATILQR